LRQVLSAWPVIQKELLAYVKRIRKSIRGYSNGSSKATLFYLRVFTILLFSFLLLKAPFFFPQEDFFSFASQKTTGGAENKNFFISQDKPEKADYPLHFVQSNSLLSTSPPTLISTRVLGTFTDPEVQGNEIIEYQVEQGDTLASIAEKFDISLETILWANDLNKNSKIQPGKTLIVLPVSGVLHYVQKGETLSEIAKKYQANISEIAAFNELSGEDIFTGDILIVPYGKLSPPKKQKYVQKSPSIPQVPLANSYFISPTQGRISQGLHWYNAIDFQTSCGNPVFAAAGGQVLRIKYSNSGYGNHIQISHPNETATLYAHLSAILVAPGESVLQGQIIGLIGGKPGTPGAGTSTGCHIHFEVRGARNPFAR